MGEGLLEIITQFALQEVVSTDSNIYRIIEILVFYIILKRLAKLEKIKNDIHEIRKELTEHIKEDDDFKDEVAVHFIGDKK